MNAIDDRWRSERAAEVLELCERLTVKERRFLENLRSRDREPTQKQGQWLSALCERTAISVFVARVEDGDFEGADWAVAWIFRHHGLLESA
jgi:hypothetical protein